MNEQEFENGKKLILDCTNNKRIIDTLELEDIELINNTFKYAKELSDDASIFAVIDFKLLSHKLIERLLELVPKINHE